MEDLSQEFARMAKTVGPDGFHPVFRDQLERWAKQVAEIQNALRTSGHNKEAAQFVNLLKTAVNLHILFGNRSAATSNAWDAVLKYLEQTDVHPS